VPHCPSDKVTIPELTMSAKFNPSTGRQRVAQAFTDLSSMPGSAERFVSVAMIEHYEIRMFNGGHFTGDASLVWMELFDHVTKRTVDSCSCRSGDDALSEFDAFVSQAKSSTGERGPKTGNPQIKKN
jgi:hypothetical protein